MGWSNLALAFVIVVLLGASVWQGWNLYRGVPANDADEMITGVEQEADVTMDTAKAGDEAETAPGTSGPGTEQEKLRKEESQPDAEDEITRLLAAAEQGDAGSQFILGDMYAKGERVPKDDAEAVRWYRKAAEQGDSGAQSHLGAMYVIGEGVPEDDVQAYAWLSIAVAQGNETAKELRNAIKDRMTPEQIAKAQDLSREYWKDYVPER